MANGPKPKAPGLTDIVQQLVLAHVTKIGVIGVGGYSLATFWHAWNHKSWDEAATGLGYLSLAAIAAGAAFGSKKTNDIVVGSEAEKRIDSPVLPTSSSVPAIQREIDKQLAAGVPQARKTGDVPTVPV